MLVHAEARQSGDVAGVVRVEMLSAADGMVRARAYAHDGAIIGPAVSRVVNESGWAVEEFRVEMGELDEVFRKITTGDSEKPDA